MNTTTGKGRGNLQVLASAVSASLISTTLLNPLEVAKLNMQYFPLACPHYPHSRNDHDT